MTIDTLIMLAGGAVALMPFLGFPVSWDTIIFFLLGVSVIGLGIAVRRQLSRKHFTSSAQSHTLFTESIPMAEAHDDHQ